VPIDHGLIEAGASRSPTPGAARTRPRRGTTRYTLGTKHGFRNAQVTVIAPTGTIGLLMDCDTTGVEPDFALVKFKKLAGGGYFKIANARSSPRSRRWATRASRSRDPDLPARHARSRRADARRRRREAGMRGHDLRQWLTTKGANDDDLAKIKDAAPGVFELKFAFSAWGLGDETLERLGIDAEKAKADLASTAQGPGPQGLADRELGELVCGTQTVEGAPHLATSTCPSSTAPTRAARSARGSSPPRATSA
jgi:ribonucleoside-diphosphate reductase alpha chain